ncbi:GntR family transcriptional regulator [Streptomyces sp. JJ66]|uniref:GntR family transcriptional regulator n=1 Tax=Streptomyces sp. JJ66 TaxID=2803843 RepID=UPI001C59FADD|nr:GntR family transcriptional regulator [Streptomyces sp. JJ66]MBW1604439.1 GntR family transcriptional regulator [Streptomyces sp. JJ66]
MPLSAAQSARLAELYETYARRMVRYAYSQLGKWGEWGARAWTLAEDVTQQVWADVACSGARDPLLGEVLEESHACGLLHLKVKRGVSAQMTKPRVLDEPVDFADPVICNWLCPLVEAGCSLVELPGYLATMVDALPERERAALLLWLDGLNPRSIAEHLGCADTTAVRLANAAVLLLQIDNPELSGEPVELDSLAAWERQALAEVSQQRRDALLRLEPSARQVLLLRQQGVSTREISKRLGVPYDMAATASRCLPVAGAARKPAKAPTRPNAKFARVAGKLREEIKAMRPGDRLPTRVQLRERFAVGSRTIDRAWNLLRGEGLIEPNGVYGYTVARSHRDMERAA